VLRHRIVPAVVALATLAAACSHKPPATQRVISSATPTVTVRTAAPTSTASASPTPTPVQTPSHGVVSAPKTPAPNLGNANIKLTKLATLNELVAMAQRPADSTMYLAQKSGQVLAFRNGKVRSTVLDISSEVVDSGEQGLLGLTFSPNGNRMFVYFTGPGSAPGTDCGLSPSATCSGGYDILREYTFASGKAVTSTGHDILKFADPYSNHNGANIAFGADGYLYFGLGDGGNGGDPQNRAQNLDSEFGKMYRLAPSDTAPYFTVPPTNPYASGSSQCDSHGSSCRALVWAYGLRNPWRWSFDRTAHDLWIGDVGQNEWEEIDFQPASGKGGDNYGWNQMEGNHSYNGGSPPANYHRPIYEYDHSNGNCAVVGGYRYRGTRIHNLQGAYLYSDNCNGTLRAFGVRGTNAIDSRSLGVKVDGIASFGEDSSGELYVLSVGTGAFYRIDPA
jgi:glucose/arabinose dehydrogenase